MEQKEGKTRGYLLVLSTLSLMNPLSSSSTTCVVQGKWGHNLDSPIDFIADFPWYGRGGEQRKRERVERGVGQKN